MRADRLLSILLLLQVHQRITARDLAQRLEVSERTIHRDMDILSGAGIPVTAERGAGGGWALLDDYRTDLTGLNAAEIQTLFLATPTRLLADLGLRQAADAALIKLLAALPSVARQGAEYARQRIHVDAAGWQQSRDDVPILPLLQEAIWQERRVALGYRRGDGTTVERVVDPLGLVAKGSLWYLIAAADGETRTYRVSRVGSAVITDERCARPADFDLAAYWEQASVSFRANLPRYPATLRVVSAIVSQLSRVGYYARVEGVGPPGADGWTTVSVLFELEEDARACVLSFGPRVEVLEPRSLRDAVKRCAESIAALYQ